ncbi:relaxase/mobilization nuclease domain-containing protein [Pedobacter sp. Du54]|uniref:relaxase/mobilization nuclease domain-containing protein n=1 Tax=Pedobacter anseongensis TaxID=3133439 RepID=UPI0030A4BADD
MVAKIASGKSIRGIIHYNEDKVAENQAKLIMASGFAGEVEQMHIIQKLKRFERLTELNGRVKTNALHITLNFDPSDKLDNEKLQQITAEYMERIGFGEQPHLVYRHFDANHPHIHIVTTNVTKEGKRIDIHGIGYRLSENARIEIEKEYKLVQASGRQLRNVLGIKAAEIEKATYGSKPTKRTISNIVSAVMRTYRYTSFAEYNAVLKQFNITAIRGREDTKMFENRGLLYSIVGEKGEPIGIPIKASHIYCKPTLDNIGKQSGFNKEKRKVLKEPLISAIEKVFDRYHGLTRSTFIEELDKRNIACLFRQNEQGFIYGVTFIDHNRKTAFNGSDLHKSYGAKALLERFRETDVPIKKEKETHLQQQEKTDFLKPSTPTNFLDMILAKGNNEPAPLLGKKRRRKKGKSQGQEPQQGL